MWEGIRSGLRTSWLALSLSAALSISLPTAASMAGVAAAAPAAGTFVVAAGGPIRVHSTPPCERRCSPPKARDGRNTAARRGEQRTKPPQHRTPSHSRWKTASTLVHVPAGGIVARRNPWSSASTVGRVASVSKYYGVPIVLWVDEINAKGTWGRVELPYVWPRVEGWIPLAKLAREKTFVHVDVDLSEHRVRVYKRDDLLYSVAGATGDLVLADAPGRLCGDGPRAVPVRGCVGHVRVRDQRHPAASARGVERWEPARDPRHQLPVLDRHERLGRLCARERVGAGSVQAAPELGTPVLIHA